MSIEPFRMRSCSTTIALLFSLLFSIPAASQSKQNPYERRWSEVYRFELRGLPRSALAVVDTLYAQAKHDHNLTEAAKAIFYQVKFTSQLQEDAELEIVHKFKSEIASSKPPLKNILESVLARTYWEHFQAHRWQYNERSHTLDKVNTADFRTWDSQQMMEEIHHHFQGSLQPADVLKNTKLSELNDILTPAENSRLYRPTVYDLLAHEALDFYNQSDYRNEETAHWPALKDPRVFDAFDLLKPGKAADTVSHLWQSIRIMKDLMTFHRQLKDTFAMVDLEREKLMFLVRESFPEDRDQLRLQALEKLSQTYRRHPVSALLDFDLASARYRSANPKTDRFGKRDALALCDAAIARFPASDGAQKCMSLRDAILRQNLSVALEKFIPIQTLSRINIEYQNIDSLSIDIRRITPDFEKLVGDNVSDSALIHAAGMLTRETQWTVSLPQTGDYEKHSTEIVVPKLSNGKYLAWVSAIHTKASPVFVLAAFQVTDLAMLETVFDGQYRYQIVDRMNGKPIVGAEVHFKTRDQKAEVQIDEHYTSDKTGFTELNRRVSQYAPGLEATVRYQNDVAVFGDYRWYYRSKKDDDDDDEAEINVQSYLFSDRSIYRPGQTVYFKGILTKTVGKKTTVVHGEWVEVVLEDVNGSDVSTLRLKTNDYGSFSGEFKLPAGGLTGEYTLTADEDMEEDSKLYDNIDDFDPAELAISVEEYKRPTFEASIQPVTKTYLVNDTVSVKGNAMSFSGAKVTGAKFKYRVTRTERHTHWYDDYSDEGDDDDGDEIIQGEGTTDAAGEFTITFAAEPDESVARKEIPIFQYMVTADITDVNGETHTAKSTVNVGYTAITATMNVPHRVDRSTPLVVPIITENLNHQFAPASGSIAVYKLKFPAAPVRPRPWLAPDMPLLTEADFNKLFPHERYGNEPGERALQRGKRMTELTFNTAVSKEITIKPNRDWPIGDYAIELITVDVSGDTIRALRRFTLFDPGARTVHDNQLVVFQLDKNFYRAGDVAKITIGSAAPDVTFTIIVEKDHKIATTIVDQFSNNLRVYEVPITTAIREGFSVHYTAVCYNSVLQGARTAQIESDKRHLEIETVTFKDKLQPGATETWSFAIKGDDALKRHVEVLASMYDASLDQFKPHTWRFSPIQRSWYYSSVSMSGGQSFDDLTASARSNVYNAYAVPNQYYDALYSFGFSMRDKAQMNRLYMERLYAVPNPNKPSHISFGIRADGRKGYVSGKVTSATGEPLSAVNVRILGTSTGTITNALGEYALAVDRGDTLAFSFIGYRTAQGAVGRQNIMNVVMEEEVLALSEVVVTGYGMTVRKELVGSVVQVRQETSDIYFGAALQGRVAGVQVSGMPGGTMRLLIRGMSSVDGSTNPLYVVDGVIVESSTIDQADLGDVHFLKGQAAIALYGARAANGVIVVSTKSGQKKLDETMAKINARKTFNETAFFLPHLTTDKNGIIRFTFTTPETLTRWKLQLLGHTPDLVTTSQTLQTVTQKELMVTPNVPRFLREGDSLILSVKIANLTGRSKKGKAVLELTNPLTGAVIDALFLNVERYKSFDVDARGNTEVSWTLHVPAGIEAVQYKVVAKAGAFSDGEQNALPVLSNRILVTETLPMYVRSGQTKTFTLEKLKTVNSPTLTHHRVTLEVTSNPAWLAIKSLPYLMEFPHECAEQLFSRYYANSLAGHIANSDPKMKDVFAAWSASGALTSNLEKNQDLKSIIIQETPWLRDAQNETEQQQRLGMLFDLKNVKEQTASVIYKLNEMQLSNGGFPWFTGGEHASRYITQHVACGYGHLKQLHATAPNDDALAMIRKAVIYLDSGIIDDYEDLQRRAYELYRDTKDSATMKKQVNAFMETQDCASVQIHYLYMRSFFPDVPVAKNLAPVLAYYRKQSVHRWQFLDLYLKGMAALIQYRDGNVPMARAIVASLKETSLNTDEMGMYWKDNVASCYWDHAPVETQALLIEAFAEIEGSDNTLTPEAKTKTLDELRIWLLKNKQTHQWRTTKATTEAIYALVLTGSRWLPLDRTLDVSIDNKKIEPAAQSVESGTGYFKTDWKSETVKPALATVTLAKKDAGIAWAALYWQYFEDLDKITSAETSLKLSKKVFVVNHNAQGELLTEVTKQPVKVGDLLRVRLELRTDRPLEFVHLKDMRAAGLEPVDVLSAYKWQAGLGYYQSTKDAATHFFFDDLPKGVYVFEYDLRANGAGSFSNGIATMQSMYAPEFACHSDGLQLNVQR